MEITYKVAANGKAGAEGPSEFRVPSVRTCVPCCVSALLAPYQLGHVQDTVR